MKRRNRASARKHLDSRFAQMRPLADVATKPSVGWIRAIRQGLGMNAAQLAQRMGVSQPRVIALEHGEATGAINLKTLQRAAEALDCSLYYVLVPNDSLERRVYDRARSVATEQIARAEHTMRLEDQPSSEEAQEARLREVTEILVTDAPQTLWGRR